MAWEYTKTEDRKNTAKNLKAKENPSFLAVDVYYMY